MEQTFKTQLRAIGPKGAWCCINPPFDVHEVFGTRGRVPVVGTLNGHAFRNSLMPEGNGTHRMMISKELRAAANARPGDLVDISLSLDKAERTADIPAEFQQALDADTEAATIFDELSPSHRKEYAEWIAQAKKPETKVARVTKAIVLIKSGQKRLR